MEDDAAIVGTGEADAAPFALTSTEEEPVEESPARGPADTGLGSAQLLPLDQILEKENVRQVYQDLDELATSIKEQGLIEPVVVRPSDEDPGKYELVCGYRRLAATRLLGWTEIPALIRPGSVAECVEMAVVENIQRQSLSPMEEARAIQRLLDLRLGNRSQVAKRLGRDPSYVTHRLNLLQMPEKVQALVEEGKLSASHAKVLERLPEEKREKFAEKALTHELSVHKLEDWVDQEIEADAKKQEPEETPQEDRSEGLPPTPIIPLQLGDVSEVMWARLKLYAFAKMCNDYKFWHEQGLDYLNIWPWVADLSAEECEEAHRVLVKRWVEAGHRRMASAILERPLVFALDSFAEPQPFDPVLLDTAQLTQDVSENPPQKKKRGRKKKPADEGAYAETSAEEPPALDDLENAGATEESPAA